MPVTSPPPSPAPSPGALDPATLAHLQQWVGRCETQHDELTPVPVRALAATLDLAAQPCEAGALLPPLWHWLYFLPLAPQGELGPDGHPRRGGFLPPVPLPRRMWAGGRLEWAPSAALRVGQRVARHSCIAAVSHKAGRSGDLLFVDVCHQLRGEQGLALTEHHDIVYRAAAGPGDPGPAPVAAPASARWQHEIVPDDVLLFRYSALTFNGHRIHYDRRYATTVEGYPGLVVHGPLIATLLAGLVRRHAPQRFMRRFEFRAVRPTFDGQPFRVCAEPEADGHGVRLWAQDHAGWLTMEARAELA